MNSENQKCIKNEETAYKFIQTGLYEEAIDIYKNIKPNSRRLFNLSMLYLQIGNYGAALCNLEDAASLDNWLTVAYFIMATIYQDMTMYSKALDMYQICLLSMRNHDAVEYQQLGLNMSVQADDVIIGLGMCKMELGMVDQAFSHFKMANIENHELHLHMKSNLNPMHFNAYFVPKISKMKNRNYFLGSPKTISQISASTNEIKRRQSERPFEEPRTKTKRSHSAMDFLFNVEKY